MGASYTEVVLDNSFYTTYGQDGKFIIHRKVSGGKWLASYEVEYPGEIFRDYNVIPGTHYQYRFKFVLGARDSDWSKTIFLTAPYPPTPTPTHAVYKYEYSHKIHHPRLSGVTGRYVHTKDKDTGCVRADNIDGNNSAIYCPSEEVWLMTPSRTFIIVDYDGPLDPATAAASQNDPFRDEIEGVYYSHNSIDSTSRLDKSTRPVDDTTAIYSPNPRINDNWVIAASGNEITNFRLPFPMQQDGGSIITSLLSRFVVKTVHDASLLPAHHVRALLKSPGVYFYRYDTDCTKIPTEWDTAPHWKDTIVDQPPVVVPFEPTPTPTPTYSPTPTPTPTYTSPVVYTPTPTPTPTISPTPSPTPTDYAVAMRQCVITPTPTPSLTPTLTFTPTPTPTPSVTPTPTPTDVAIVVDICDPSRIITEDGIDIITENGYYLITE